MKTDINDTVRAEGLDAARARHDQARKFIAGDGGSGGERSPRLTRERFKLTAIADIVLDDEPLWLVEDIVPAGPSLVVIFGKPKSGKTFLTADLFLHLALGREYCGCPVRQGAVVYVTSEGVRGFKRRMVAMREHHSLDAGAPFFTVPTMPKLGTACGDAEAIVKAISAVVPSETPVAAVIIDTLARAMPGQNDGETAAMSQFVENCDVIGRALGCCVVAVHHSPRNDDSRSRGSNVLDGAADAIISVVKDGASGISTAKVDRLKDGDEGTTWQFRIAICDVENRNKKTCFAPLCETLGTVTRKSECETGRNKKLKGAKQRFIDLLAEAILDHGQPVTGSAIVPTGVKVVTREQLKKCLLNAGFLNRKNKNSARTTMNRAINELAGMHLIGTTEEYVWLPK